MSQHPGVAPVPEVLQRFAACGEAAAAAFVPPAPSAVIPPSAPAEHVAAPADNRHARLLPRAASVGPVAQEPPFGLEQCQLRDSAAVGPAAELAPLELEAL